ncbi:SDR family oxidoreductase [Paraburkholderia sp. BL25I1N1]|uniref:SDR family oxidoreductase n=1 Tax=Paraburkholderia sp. BL25I1N1 TaxID=1938804 RepID=UPI000D05FD49|nr:SDR family NAD(P)-dependent oxidoreductase [Paraburkholderia sp. BL25I1N1]PRY07795.1 NADP-dependent 3-hydroxy acid dehydrogenase YdfG [Paraburkholderia sp. BL25I1N1]
MREGIKGKVVLIVGGAGGIGSAAAKALAADGAIVAVADIDPNRSDLLVRHILAEGGEARRYDVDVTRKKDIELVVSAVVADFGKLDVLINSAGVMLIRPMVEVNTEEWETTIDLNLKGTLWGIGAALPVFLRRGFGHVINLGSVHGLKVFSPGGAVHSASKFAIRALSEGLRAEMAGYPIRVTSITPGAVDSGIQNKTTGTDSARILEIYKKAISPTAVARAITFAIEQPVDVDINEIVVRPTAQLL